MTQTPTTRYQKRQAYDLNQSEYYCRQSVLSGSSKSITTLPNNLYQLIKQSYTGVNDDENIFTTNNAEINGVRYKKNDIILWTLSGGELELPEFLRIVTIIEIRSQWFIYGQSMNNIGFNESIHAYEVTDNIHHRLLQPGSEVNPSTLSSYQIAEKLFIPLRHKLTINVSPL